ncbi:hypothetical protein GALL_399590 [mine drainage metagenome]|uniref:Uncharacterized protein n=1 Tax=mine drainage metagenome TaxID=410659 RepID=A0A1J5QLE1_9ZZZZ
MDANTPCQSRFTEPKPGDFALGNCADSIDTHFPLQHIEERTILWSHVKRDRPVCMELGFNESQRPQAAIRLGATVVGTSVDDHLHAVSLVQQRVGKMLLKRAGRGGLHGRRQVKPELEGVQSFATLRMAAVKDTASRPGPLYVATSQHAARAQVVLVPHGAFENQGYRLETSMRMHVETGNLRLDPVLDQKEEGRTVPLVFRVHDKAVTSAFA